MWDERRVAATGQPGSPQVVWDTRATHDVPNPRVPEAGLGAGGRGTHADLQVLQEVLQEAGAHAKRPLTLVAPRGLDPWA